MAFTDSDTEEISDEQITEDKPSSSVEDISQKSAQIAVVTAFERSSLQDLSVKAHLIPIAKQLGVRYRSKGKRDLLTPIAKQLFLQGYLESEADPINFKSSKGVSLRLSDLFFKMAILPLILIQRDHLQQIMINDLFIPLPVAFSLVSH